MAPIISEQNGWYELYGIGPNESNGWVSAQYCETIQPKPLRPGQYNTVDFVWLKNSGDADGGNYAIYCDYNDRYGTAVFYVGREINGILVCPYRICCQSEYKSDKTPGIYVDNSGEVIHYYFTYGDNESTPLGFDLSKFSVKALESIVDAAEKADKPAYVYRMNGIYFLSGGIIGD
ncbi:MAG: hypothetical protein K2J58_07455 [Muribaculaceae bacterium]|nr:hypothetical protein [Muribaculaceae bacterium]